MSSLTFRGVTLYYPDLRRKESAVFCRIHFSAELTSPVSEAMVWPEVPSVVNSAKLEGSLTADKFILSPTDKKLKDFEIELQCSRVEDFLLSRKQEEGGDSIVTRIRFIAVCEQVGAIADIENWMRSVGGAPASLKVTYHEQEEMDLKPNATEEEE